MTENLSLNSLRSICPLDGRYYTRLNSLRDFFSESALIKSRISVEINYVIRLSKILNMSPEKITFWERGLSFVSSNQAIERIKQIESKIHHDVKAVEICLREYYQELINDDSVDTTNIEQGDLEWIHFGLTSQDINHLAFADLLDSYIQGAFLTQWKRFITSLEHLSKEWIDIELLSYTHGQPATPSTLGAQMMVFVERWTRIIQKIESIRLTVKFGGATGGLHVHKNLFPDIDWSREMDHFIANYRGENRLARQQWTTQIDHYDCLAEIFNLFSQISTVGIDFCRDIWSYISMEYLGLRKVSKEQVGSSTMPHKVNPIDFEQAEGNFMLAVNLLQFFSRKLPVSRLQRDLTDSTVGRNIGVAIGHLDLGYQSISKGLTLISPRKDRIKSDLENHPEVWAELAQSYLRANGVENPYGKFRQGLQSVTDKNIICRTLYSLIENCNESRNSASDNSERNRESDSDNGNRDDNNDKGKIITKTRLLELLATHGVQKPSV